MVALRHNANEIFSKHLNGSVFFFHRSERQPPGCFWSQDVHVENLVPRFELSARPLRMFLGSFTRYDFTKDKRVGGKKGVS
jgi:hypothetical protein